ncbi:reverse transcriptase domain-containing protein [Undibacterium luofuense]|uniref:RNA-directed DNA polymerase n=1 Tax=Undibacterium luofuense TaxID=2828733 RepID=A0A941DQR3_9BURK|nr:reverse transcriptase domain-containing protein [Undibacterium luofuense]MBR7783126.1 RNA-directed DNA polymerase [Undibacterium luofuense]
MMEKQPLRALFNAMYHEKFNFDDFLTYSVSDSYEISSKEKLFERKFKKPKDMVKNYHRFLNLFVFDYLETNPRVVFSYKKGLSALNAVERHSLSKFFFQTDISSFFESIDKKLIRETIVAGCSACPVSDIDLYIDRIVDIVCIDNALPVGLPCSAPISNAVLLLFDNEIEKICAQRNLIYTRYSDDIIISGMERSSLDGIDKQVRGSLEVIYNNKFSINIAKTKFFKVGNKISILGVNILPNGKVTPDKSKKEELEILLHFYLTDRDKFISRASEMKRGNKNTLSEEDCLNLLGGNLNYVDSIDKDYTDKLRRKFGVVTIDKLIHRGFPVKK